MNTTQQYLRCTNIEQTKVGSAANNDANGGEISVQVDFGVLDDGVESRSVTNDVSLPPRESLKGEMSVLHLQNMLVSQLTSDVGADGELIVLGLLDLQQSETSHNVTDLNGLHVLVLVTHPNAIRGIQREEDSSEQYLSILLFSKPQHQ